MQIPIALRLCLTISLTNYEAGRSFSKLKVSNKIRLRSTQIEGRLNALTNISIIEKYDILCKQTLVR